MKCNNFKIISKELKSVAPRILNGRNQNLIMYVWQNNYDADEESENCR